MRMADFSGSSSMPPERSIGQWFRQLKSNPCLAMYMAVAMPSGAASPSASLLTSVPSCFVAHLLIAHKPICCAATVWSVNAGYLPGPWVAS